MTNTAPNFSTDFSQTKVGDLLLLDDGTRLRVNHVQTLSPTLVAFRGPEVTKTGRKVVAGDGEGNCINVFVNPQTNSIA